MTSRWLICPKEWNTVIPIYHGMFSMNFRSKAKKICWSLVGVMEFTQKSERRFWSFHNLQLNLVFKPVSKCLHFRSTFCFWFAEENAKSTYIVTLLLLQKNEYCDTISHSHQANFFANCWIKPQETFNLGIFLKINLQIHAIFRISLHVFYLVLHNLLISIWSSESRLIESFGITNLCVCDKLR